MCGNEWLTVPTVIFFSCRFFLVISRACPPYWRLSTSYSCVKTKISHSLLATTKMLQVRKWHIPFFFFNCAFICIYLLILCKKSTTWACVSAFVATGETPGATTADGIHMVPFQFDLMTLLPRCQQIELFFYTFSKGTATMSIFTYCYGPNDTRQRFYYLKCVFSQWVSPSLMSWWVQNISQRKILLIY